MKNTGVAAIIVIIGGYKIVSKIVTTRCKKEDTSNPSAEDPTRPHNPPGQQMFTAEGAAAASSMTPKSQITLDQETMTALFKNAIQEAKELTDEDDENDAEKRKRNRRKRYPKE